MPFHLYKVCNEDAEPLWFGIRIEYDEDRWVSTSRQVSEEGEEIAGGATITPKFYGMTAKQAHRRMLEALENAYDEVIPATKGACL